MTGNVRRRWLMGLILTTLAVMGCNPLTGLFFLINGESKIDPDPRARLLPPPGKKEAKVLVLASTGPNLPPELLGFDRDLATAFSRQLKERCTENGEAIDLIPAHKVERYKVEHPSWKTADPCAIGEEFGADYVIDLEVTSIDLYEPGSNRTLLRGRPRISVRLYDVSKPEEGAIYPSEYDTEYPATHPIDASSGNPAQFKLALLNRVATDLSWLFTAHRVQEQHNLK